MSEFSHNSIEVFLFWGQLTSSLRDSVLLIFTLGVLIPIVVVAASVIAIRLCLSHVGNKMCSTVPDT